MDRCKTLVRRRVGFRQRVGLIPERGRRRVFPSGWCWGARVLVWVLVAVEVLVWAEGGEE